MADSKVAWMVVPMAAKMVVLTESKWADKKVVCWAVLWVGVLVVHWAGKLAAWKAVRWAVSRVVHWAAPSVFYLVVPLVASLVPMRAVTKAVWKADPTAGLWEQSKAGQRVANLAEWRVDLTEPC